MNSIILNDDLKAKLAGQTWVVEMREPEGKLVGQFVPPALFHKMFYAWLWSLVPPDELTKARLSEGAGRSLSEIFADRGKK